MTPREPRTGLLDIRRLSAVGPNGCCSGLQEDLQEIHAAVNRGVFGGALAQPSINSDTLGQMLASLGRQVTAARDLQSQLHRCGADDDLKAELAHLAERIEAYRDDSTSRLGVPCPRSGPARQ